MSVSLKYFLLNCVLIVDVDTPRAKLNLKIMGKSIHQTITEIYLGISIKISKIKNNIRFSNEPQWSLRKTVGIKWLNVYVRNECKWDPPFITYGCIEIYSITVEIWKSFLSLYSSAVTQAWEVSEARNSAR